MKGLAILAVIFASAINQTGQENKRPDLAKHKGDDQASPAGNFVLSEKRNEHPGPNKEAAETKSSHWYASPEWWLCILGVPTLVILIWQANETRRAALAAKDAADAALLNAQALINAERPWLLVIIEAPKDQPGVFSVGGLNKGNTPAELIEGHSSVRLHPLGFTGPLVGSEEEDPFLLPMKNLIVSGDSFPIHKFTPDQHPQGSEAHPQRLYVYGRLSYWDTFTDRTAPGAKPHVTRWLFQFDEQQCRFARCAGGYTQNT